MPRAIPLLLPGLVLLGVLAGCAGRPQRDAAGYGPTFEMAAVLREHRAMHAMDLSNFSAADARDVPSLVDAARAIPNVHGLPSPTSPVAQVSPLVASGAAGPLAARLYRPAVTRNTPVILYFIGGTWATGTLDGYDETARQLSLRTGYIVVSLRTRLAPEATFPAAHDDALALYRWARAHVREWGGDPTRVALAGEGPGANLAISTALAARDGVGGPAVPMPDHLLLITPVAGTGLRTPSMRQNVAYRPLSRDTVDWAQRLYARRNLADPRIDVVARPDLTRLPPTTIIVAGIDPLRSGGEALGARLRAAGVASETRVFPGTTYDFFGLGLAVPAAAQAEDYAASRLKAAFDRPEPPSLRGLVRPRRRS